MKHADILSGKTYTGRGTWGGPRKVLKIIRDDETNVVIVICTSSYGPNEIYSLKGFASWAKAEYIPKE